MSGWSLLLVVSQSDVQEYREYFLTLKITHSPVKLCVLPHTQMPSPTSLTPLLSRSSIWRMARMVMGILRHDFTRLIWVFIVLMQLNHCLTSCSNSTTTNIRTLFRQRSSFEVDDYTFLGLNWGNLRHHGQVFVYFWRYVVEFRMCV